MQSGSEIMKSELINRVRTAFISTFGRPPDGIFHAPARVNLIGEHTDYNDGFVLPCAIRFGTAIAFSAGPEGVVDAVAADYASGRDRFDANAIIDHHPELPWANHLRGVASAMKARGWRVSGARLAIAGDVPRDAGLSSSASLGVALGGAFRALSGQVAIEANELARIAQAAENDFVGCACGIMDQLASAAATAGHAALIDCRSLSLAHIPVPRDAAIIVMHSGIRRGLVDSAYNERRRQCELAADVLGVAALRDATLDGLLEARPQMSDVVFRRARHVITENARTLEAAQALAEGDIVRMGTLMAASHESMRSDFEITVPALDSLVIALKEIIGAAGGARMTGGGFGGCVVMLVPANRAADVLTRLPPGLAGPDGGAPLAFETPAEPGARLV